MTEARGHAEKGLCPDGRLEDADIPRKDGDRLDEVAQLLALGVMRLRARERGASQTGVDFSAGQSVCGTEPENIGESE